MKQQDSLTCLFAVLADPTRRAILAHLATGEKTVNELAEPFALSLPAISKHLKVLERGRFIMQPFLAQSVGLAAFARALLQELFGRMDGSPHRRPWAESSGPLAEHLRENAIRTPQGQTQCPG